MANTPETRTTFTNLLKQVFAPAIMQATAEQSFTLSHLEAVAGKVVDQGKNFYLPVLFNNNGSTGSRPEGGTMPTALPGSDTQSTIGIAYHYFTMSLSGPVMKTSDSSPEAWADAFSNALRVKSRAFRQQMNRQLLGDGLGILCQCSTSAASTVVEVDNAYGLSGFNNSQVNGAKFLTSNMIVDFFTSDTIRDVANTATIESIVPGSFPSTEALVTFSAAGDVDEVVDGDYCYVGSNKSDSSVYEMEGFQSLIDDGTKNASFQGIAVATYPEWKSQVKYGATPGTAEALTTNRIQEVIDDIEVAGGNVDWILTSNAVYLTYGEMARSENQIVTYDTIKGYLDTGWKAIMHNGIPIYKDPYCIDHMFFVDNRAIKLHESAPMGWLDYGDGILHRDGNKDQWQCEWAWYANAAVHNRAWLGKLQDITVTANKI